MRLEAGTAAPDFERALGAQDVVIDESFVADEDLGIEALHGRVPSVAAERDAIVRVIDSEDPDFSVFELTNPPLCLDRQADVGASVHGERLRRTHYVILGFGRNVECRDAFPVLLPRVAIDGERALVNDADD